MTNRYSYESRSRTGRSGSRASETDKWPSARSSCSPIAYRPQCKPDLQDVRYFFLVAAAGNTPQSEFAPEPAEWRRLASLTPHDYVYRSIAITRVSGSFHTWKFKTHANVADKGSLPVYSRRLREAREAHDISQRALGIKAGLDEFVASTRVNRYETGVHQPDLQTLQRLAAILKLPVAYFYAEDDELAQLIKDFKGSGKRKR